MSAPAPHVDAPGRRLDITGYGPLIGLVIAFVAMVIAVPSLPPQKVSVDSGGTTPVAGQDGQVASGAGQVTPCPDRKEQVADDPYAPPCFSFSGSNGGATSRGVNDTDIIITYRHTSDPDYMSTIMAMAGSDLPPQTIEDVIRTVEGLVEYFNKNFQFYGRHIKLVPVDAKGTVIGEIFGGGQDAATADAVKVATEIGAFADISAITEPYANALTRRQVIALGAPYVSDEWFNDRRPYGWSIAPSCSLVAKAATEISTKQLFGRPAKYAGDEFKGRTRKIAIITPDNPEYQRCVKTGMDVVHQSGNDALQLTYTLDLATLQSQAASLVSRLKSEGITSVGCACDPLLPVSLTGKAQEQGYEPEWLVMGTALTDTDIAGQLYQQEQWSRAFGATALGDQLPLTANLAHKAYKTVRDDEPALSGELLYFQLYQLAIGLQMAGPDLTPQTFEQGMFNYPEHTGEGGTWKWGPGKYTPQQDARAIWWDPERVSVIDAEKGAYVPLPERYRIGGVPTEELRVFEK